MDLQISVVVPIYNVEQYLQTCLQSIVGRHEDITEILLIDDGSTDSSGDIADSYAQKYPNVKAYHKQNGGLSDARNYGLSRARGKYVFFPDSDDFVKENTLDILLAQIAERDLDVVLWDADIYNEKGEKSAADSSYYHHAGAVSDCICTGTDVIKEQIAHRNDYVTTVWLGLYNRRLLLENNLWFEKGLLHEDEMWTQKVFIAAERVLYLNEALYCYRKRQNSIMRQADKNSSANIACLIYIHTSLMAYYDWKIDDAALKKMLKGNTVKRYLHMIGKYEVYKYPTLKKRIDRKQLFLNANTKKDKIRAFILMVNIRLYCVMNKKMMKNKDTF